MNADGIIDTLPIDDFNKKFKEIIEKISETVDIKTKEQIQEKLETLKTEIETFKSKKITEITDDITVEKNNFIREIREVKDNSKRELDSRMPEINNKFNSIAGGQLNPSFIQDVGEKTNGQFYLDRNTSRLHKCIKTTSTTINSAEFFKDMSIDSIVNKFENLIKTDSFLAHNEGWFELFGRVIYYGTVQYNGSSSYTQDFTLKIEIPNWKYANVICCLRETNQKFIDKTFSAKLSNSNKLSVRANLSNAELATVSYLIIARV